MMEFRIRKRAEAGREMPSEAEAQVIEVWNGQQVVAPIYLTDDGVRIVAPGLTAIHRSYDGPPAVTVILR
jgi:hypothetical protein